MLYMLEKGTLLQGLQEQGHMYCMQEAPPNYIACRSSARRRVSFTDSFAGRREYILPVMLCEYRRRWYNIHDCSCKLSSTKSESETLVYALLDNQSSHTFVVQEVCKSLQALMGPVKLKTFHYDGEGFHCGESKSQWP